jgi:predicted ArsR family transcriptional regulator
VTRDNGDLAAWTRAVLGTLWQAGRPLTREELAAALDVRLETVDAVVDSLTARGLVSVTAIGPATRGPLPLAYDEHGGDKANAVLPSVDDRRTAGFSS